MLARLSIKLRVLNLLITDCPAEIWLEVLKLCDCLTLIQLTKTCRFFQTLIRNTIELHILLDLNCLNNAFTVVMDNEGRQITRHLFLSFSYMKAALRLCSNHLMMARLPLPIKHLEIRNNDVFSQINVLLAVKGIYKFLTAVKMGKPRCVNYTKLYLALSK